MDGTIYLSDRLFQGAAEFLSLVKARGGRYVFLTNNSSRGTEAYMEKMARLGIETCPEDYLTSADAAIRGLLRRGDDLPWYVCGTESLKGQLRAGGIRVAETREEARGVLLGYDTELTYGKLEDCCILLGEGVPYAATHPDPVCPTWWGSAPDCGCVPSGGPGLHGHRLRGERRDRHRFRSLRRRRGGGHRKIRRRSHPDRPWGVDAA